MTAPAPSHTRTQITQAIPSCHPYAKITHKVRKFASHVVHSRMQLTLHATRRTRKFASRLVHAMSAWSVNSRRAPSRHCRNARDGVEDYGYAWNDHPPLPRPRPPSRAPQFCHHISLREAAIAPVSRRPCRGHLTKHGYANESCATPCECCALCLPPSPRLPCR